MNKRQSFIHWKVTQLQTIDHPALWCGKTFLLRLTMGILILIVQCKMTPKKINIHINIVPLSTTLVPAGHALLSLSLLSLLRQEWNRKNNLLPSNPADGKGNKGEQGEVEAAGWWEFTWGKALKCLSKCFHLSVCVLAFVAILSIRSASNTSHSDRCAHVMGMLFPALESGGSRQQSCG